MKKLSTVTVPALKGKKVIASSKGIFTYIDSDFKNWGADKPGTPTKETKLDIFEMDTDATFEQMMSKDNVLTQEQILYFVENHKDQLKQDGYATFFPFKSGDDFFVAGVYLDSDGPDVYVDRLSDDCVWYAERRRRVVTPQLTVNPSEARALTLGDSSESLLLRIEKIEETLNKIKKLL